MTSQTGPATLDEREAGPHRPFDDAITAAGTVAPAEANPPPAAVALTYLAGHLAGGAV
jgi:hypothetical protein